MTSLPKTCRAVDIPRRGGPDVLKVVERPVLAPGPDEVLVEVLAAGVNRADLKQREGIYPMPPDAPSIPGLEVAGRIVGKGQMVTRWNCGDMVCALVVGGGYAEYCIAPAVQCLPIPSSLDPIPAAALPEAFFTVWAALFEQARLLPGETVLIHGGASGIGTTAIQLAYAFGARVIVTAGSDEKCRTCVDLGAEQAINYRNEDFAAAVLEVTRGRGVDVVLDMVGAPYLERNMGIMAMGGRIAYIAYGDGKVASFDIQKLMLRRVTLTGSTLRHRDKAEKGRIAAALETRVWPLLAAGRIRPVVSKVFPLAAAAAAHRHLDGSGNIGKVVLSTGLPLDRPVA